jgi:CheY-like chemotaxis protein
VLVVDDDKAVVDSTRMWLEMAGFDVRSARSGLEALQQATDFLPQAVLLDIGLAGMDGYETARRLRALPEGKDVFLVAVTGYGHDEAVTRTLASGFDQHVVKPFDPRALLTLLSSRLPNP